MQKVYSDPDDPFVSNAVEMNLRVRFQETDMMGITWHGNYFSWFEMGRLEHLRHHNIDYRELEKMDCYFAVIHAECDYKKPAKYDDNLTLITEIERMTPVKIIHRYTLYRDSDLLAKGKTIVVTLNSKGELRRVPDILMRFKERFVVKKLNESIE